MRRTLRILATVFVFLVILVNPVFGSDIFELAKSGDLNKIKSFGGLATSINSKNKFGQTALFVAAVNQHKELVKFFIESGADVNIKDNYGFTVSQFLQSLINRSGVNRDKGIQSLRSQGLSEEVIKQMTGSNVVEGYQGTDDDLRKWTDILNLISTRNP